MEEEEIVTLWWRSLTNTMQGLRSISTVINHTEYIHPWCDVMMWWQWNYKERWINYGLVNKNSPVLVHLQMFHANVSLRSRAKPVSLNLKSHKSFLTPWTLCPKYSPSLSHITRSTPRFWWSLAGGHCKTIIQMKNNDC